MTRTHADASPIEDIPASQQLLYRVVGTFMLYKRYSLDLHGGKTPLRNDWLILSLGTKGTQDHIKYFSIWVRVSTRPFQNNHPRCDDDASTHRHTDKVIR